MCQRYPDYKVFIRGVGDGPTGKEHIGMCSQLACFVRKDFWDQSAEMNDAETQLIMPVYATDFDYKHIFSKPFPYDNNVRTADEIALDEFRYFVNRYCGLYNDYYIMEENVYAFPLSDAIRCMNGVVNEDELRELLLRNNYTIRNDEVIVIAEDEDDYDDRDDYYGDDEPNIDNYVNNDDGAGRRDEPDEEW